VADYTDSNRMHGIFVQNQVNIVFHAAAYKHVPLMEQNPREALKNNVFGLLTFLDVAKAADCEKFILISSDKAVNPTSITISENMGRSTGPISAQNSLPAAPAKRSRQSISPIHVPRSFRLFSSLIPPRR
jgi:UDP-glucose 4-epimerase